MKNIFKNIALVLSVLAVSIIVSYAVMAWTEPGGNPPNSNIAAPINTGEIAQTKTGDLKSGGKITANQFCIGAACVSLWPQAKTCANGEAITGYNATTGTFACGAGGAACKPTTTCDTLGYQCGAATNNCGALDCGTCDIGICTDHQCVCKGSAQTCTVNADCCSGACTSKKCTTYYPCTVKESTDPTKKLIFVTSATYKGSDFTNVGAGGYVMDNLVFNKYCQAAADKVGLAKNGQKYRGLVHFNWYASGWNLKEYDPIDALPSGVTFWSPRKNAANDNCSFEMVANSASTIFAADGIAKRIYDETGTASLATVWTNFKPTGNGTYVSFENTAGDEMCSCSHGGGTMPVANNIDAESCYGQANYSTNIKWAYTIEKYHLNACIDCLNETRALYCVEQ